MHFTFLQSNLLVHALLFFSFFLPSILCFARKSTQVISKSLQWIGYIDDFPNAHLVCLKASRQLLTIVWEMVTLDCACQWFPFLQLPSHHGYIFILAKISMTTTFLFLLYVSRVEASFLSTMCCSWPSIHDSVWRPENLSYIAVPRKSNQCCV